MPTCPQNTPTIGEQSTKHNATNEANARNLYPIRHHSSALKAAYDITSSVAAPTAWANSLCAPAQAVTGHGAETVHVRAQNQHRASLCEDPPRPYRRPRHLQPQRRARWRRIPHALRLNAGLILRGSRTPVHSPPTPFAPAPRASMCSQNVRPGTFGPSGP